MNIAPEVTEILGQNSLSTKIPRLENLGLSLYIGLRVCSFGYFFMKLMALY